MRFFLRFSVQTLFLLSDGDGLVVNGGLEHATLEKEKDDTQIIFNIQKPPGNFSLKTTVTTWVNIYHIICYSVETTVDSYLAGRK